MNLHPTRSHPTPQEWAGFLYQELPPDRFGECRQHLETCADCRQAVEGWRATLRALDSWCVPLRPAARARWRMPRLPWAAAAAGVLGAGLLLGRLSAPAPGVEQLRAVLVPALRDELRANFEDRLRTALAAANEQTDRKLEQLAGAVALAREEDQRATWSLVGQLDRQRQADLAWLRRDLETVAVNADARLTTTTRALGQLVSASPLSANPPDSGTTVNPTYERNSP
jgi:hypothetical protein